MSKFKSVVALPLFILLFSSFSSAYERFQFGIHFLSGFPQNEFKRNVDQMGYGANFSLAYHFPRSLFSVGTALSFLIYGREVREESLSLTIPDVIVDVVTTNAIVNWHFYLRLQPLQGKFRPYLDGIAGFNFLTTDTTVEHRDYSVEYISSNNYHDTAFCYGIGGGIQVRLFHKEVRRTKPASFAVYLDAGARYLKGGRAEYLKKGSIHRDDSSLTYDVYLSKTDLLKAYLGLLFSF